MKESRDLFLEFLEPLHILGTVKARNFKFGMQILGTGWFDLDEIW